MSDKAAAERRKQLESLQEQYHRTLQVRDFLVAERDIVLGLLQRSKDWERLDNLRVRVQEKDRQLKLVTQELQDITKQLAEAQQRLREVEERS